MNRKGLIKIVKVLWIGHMIWLSHFRAERLLFFIFQPHVSFEGTCKLSKPLSVPSNGPYLYSRCYLVIKAHATEYR